MRALFLAGGLAVLLGGPAPAAVAQEAPHPLTLRDAVTAALDRNPMMAGAAADRKAAAAGLAEAKSMWLPRVDASQSVMRSDNPVFVFGSLLEQGRFGAQHFDPAFLNDPDALTNDRLSVNARYMLFDQFRRFDAVKQAKNAVGRADLANDETSQRIRVETISRYYGLLLAREKQKVAADAVAAAEADAASMQARSDEGLLVESDLLSAEVQLAAFRQQLIQAEGEAAIANAALATLIQTDDLAPIAIEGSIPDRQFPEPALDEAIARAAAARGELRAAALSTDNAALQLRTARGSLLPRVDAFASWGASGSKLTGGDPDTTLGVVIGFDLFDAGKPARIAATKAAVEAARAGESGTRDKVRMEVVAAWYRARAARERIGVAARSAERATAAARIVRDRYENGLTTITEHLRAQTALVAARLDLLAARYEYLVGHAELLRSTGGMNDVEAFQ